MSPMRTSYWTALAVGILYMCSVADAQLKPRTTVQTQVGVWGNKEVVARTVMPSRALYAQGTGFNSSVQRPRSTAQQADPPTPTPPVVNVPAPVVNVAPGPAPVVNVAPGPAPVVNVAAKLEPSAPSMQSDVLQYIWTALAAIATGVLAKMGFANSSPIVPGASGIAMPNVDVLLKLKEKITDPDTRQAIDATILRVVQTGLPGMAIQTAANVLAPGAGGLAASKLEPLARQAVEDFLIKRAGIHVDPPVDPAAPASSVAMSSAPDPLANLTNVIGSLKDAIDKRFPHA